MSDKILKKLEEHDGHFVQIGQEFVQLNKRFNFLVDKFLHHEDRLHRIEETMATKTDIDRVMSYIDHFLKTHLQKDTEVTMTKNAIDRHEGRIEDLEHEMIRVNAVLQLS